MDEEHPPREELQRFMRGELDKGAVSRVVRHLLRGCPQCRRVTSPYWAIGLRPPRGEEAPADPPTTPASGAEDELEAALDRAFLAARCAAAPWRAEPS